VNHEVFSRKHNDKENFGRRAEKAKKSGSASGVREALPGRRVDGVRGFCDAYLLREGGAHPS
jgi:hypothetical protein